MYVLTISFNPVFMYFIHASCVSLTMPLPSHHLPLQLLRNTQYCHVLIAFILLYSGQLLASPAASSHVHRPLQLCNFLGRWFTPINYFNLTDTNLIDDSY